MDCRTYKLSYCLETVSIYMFAHSNNISQCVSERLLLAASLKLVIEKDKVEDCRIDSRKEGLHRWKKIVDFRKFEIRKGFW